LIFEMEQRTGGDARPSTIEIDFHFLKAYFCARKRQDRSLRLWMTQTISFISNYAQERCKGSGQAF